MSKTRADDRHPGRLLFTDFAASSKGRPLSIALDDEENQEDEAALAPSAIPTLNEVLAALDIDFEDDADSESSDGDTTEFKLAGSHAPDWAGGLATSAFADGDAFSGLAKDESNRKATRTTTVFINPESLDLIDDITPLDSDVDILSLIPPFPDASGHMDKPGERRKKGHTTTMRPVSYYRELFEAGDENNDTVELDNLENQGNDWPENIHRDSADEENKESGENNEEEEPDDTTVEELFSGLDLRDLNAAHRAKLRAESAGDTQQVEALFSELGEVLAKEIEASGKLGDSEVSTDTAILAEEEKAKLTAALKGIGPSPEELRSLDQKIREGRLKGGVDRANDDDLKNTIRMEKPEAQKKRNSGKEGWR